VRQVGMGPREGQCERAHHPRSEGLLVDCAATHRLEPAPLLVEQDLAARPGLGVARRGVRTVAKSLENQPEEARWLCRYQHALSTCSRPHAQRPRSRRPDPP
jgi:hypothetical protein